MSFFAIENFFFFLVARNEAYVFCMSLCEGGDFVMLGDDEYILINIMYELVFDLDFL